MERIATTPGLYPLPDDAKETLSDLKGHQRDDLISGDEGEDIVAAYDDARRRVIDDQQEAGLDLVTEGQLRWDDMLAHPLTVHENVSAEGIVRYYDNNNFYREPVVEDELTFSGDVAGELEAAAAQTDSLQAVLPGPYTLAELATDEHYGDEAAFLDAVADFLEGETAAFPEHETLFLLEPSLVTDSPGDGMDERASEAIDTVAKATDADVVVQTYWGSLTEKVHAHLLDADIDAVGYDLVSDHEQNIENIAEYGTKDDVSLGIVDGQTTLVESAETVAERVEWFCAETPDPITFDDIYMTTNTELFYLPVSKYREKLGVLGEAAELVEVAQ